MNSVAWWTMAGLFVRTCIFWIHTSVGNGDLTKYDVCGISPVAGTCDSIGKSITASGVPNAHPPSGNVGAGGRSLSSPFGAPASDHFTIVSTSFGDRLRSLAIFTLSALAPHGGISRATTLFFIARAHGRAFWYVMSGIGATSPGRWQTTQFL